MPCRDYDDKVTVIDHTERYQAQRDKLARIACKAMREIKRLDPGNYIFKDEEASSWFKQHELFDALEEKKKKEEEKRQAALSKLSEEDKKILKISS
jgi:hypothetical protein